MNDHKEALDQPDAVLQRVNLDLVHITRSIHPAAKTWIELPDTESLLCAFAILGASEPVI